MAIRTTATTVGGIIEVDSNVSVSPMIDVANELVDKVATNDTNGVMTVGMLRHLETYLAAYFYAIRCQQYKEKKTGDASASFQVGESGKGGQRPHPLVAQARKFLPIGIHAPL